MKSKPRISRITMARLYNLGSYEHVRYELSVDVPEGASALSAWKSITSLLHAANPKPPVDKHEYERSKSVLSDPLAWDKNIADKKERAKSIRHRVKSAKSIVAQFERWTKARQSALRQLDSLGGTSVHKDAKLSWDDNDDWD